MVVHRNSQSISFQEFFETEAAAGVVLVGCACAALALANSGAAATYHHLLDATIRLGAGEHAPALTAHQWINDGLMAIFFLLVGLEVKREVLAGELSSPRQAALPIAAAIGGMVVPAAMWTNVQQEAERPLLQVRVDDADEIFGCAPAF